MFSSRHVAAEIHAAARAVSGGPVYVSDAPGSHRQAGDTSLRTNASVWTLRYVEPICRQPAASPAANLLPPLPPICCPPCLPLTHIPPAALTCCASWCCPTARCCARCCRGGPPATRCSGMSCATATRCSRSVGTDGLCVKGPQAGRLGCAFYDEQVAATVVFEVGDLLRHPEPLPIVPRLCCAAQVWNMNATTGVVGVFNLQVRRWGCWLLCHAQPNKPSWLPSWLSSWLHRMSGLRRCLALP